VLTTIRNACLFRKYYPKMWRENRTILIPKPGKSATIGSLLARIYSGIFLHRRLKQFLSFADRQIGFTNLDRCKANINLLVKPSPA